MLPGAPGGLTRVRAYRALAIATPTRGTIRRGRVFPCIGDKVRKDCGAAAMIGVEKPAVEAAPATCLILIVEDDPLVASYIRDVLEESGFSVIGTASSGPEALALVGEVTPALALVDIRLSGKMDGIEVAQELQRRFAIRSIFLTGMDDPETLERAKIVAPLGFLRKPFRPSQVYNALQSALRHQIER